jgi:hypothetical protein
MTKCTETCDAEKAVLVAAITRIRDKAHEYGALPAEIERLADEELRAANTSSAAAARLAQGERLREALRLLRSVVETRGCPYCGWADGRHPQDDCPYRAALAPGEET